MLLGDFAQDLAVQCDAFLLQVCDELRVGRSEFPCGGIDAYRHERSIRALLELASDIGILAGLGDRGLGDADLGLASPHHALCALENIFAMLDMHHATFDSCHRFVYQVRESVSP